MRGESWLRRDIGCHVTNQVKLPIGCVAEESHHEVFQCNYADLQLYQFGVRQGRNIRLRLTRYGCSIDVATSRAAFVLPPRKRHTAQVRTVREIRLSIRHGISLEGWSSQP